MATRSALLAWRILWTEEPGGATIHRGPKESDTTEQLTAFTLSFCLNKIVFPLPEKKKKNLPFNAGDILSISGLGLDTTHSRATKCGSCNYSDLMLQLLSPCSTATEAHTP